MFPVFISIIVNIWLCIICVFHDGACILILLALSIEVLNLQTAVLSVTEQPPLSRYCLIFLV